MRSQELAKLKKENAVYKLIGPVLVKQEQAEARADVDRRLAFIKSEMCVSSRAVFLATCQCIYERYWITANALRRS